MKRETVKKIGISAAALLGALILAVIIYLLYVIFSYSRIPDNTPLSIDAGETEDSIKVGREYVAVSQNLGFGAYTADFTFFMDGGKESRAASRESVIECIGKGIDAVSALSPDIILFALQFRIMAILPPAIPPT